MKKVLLIITVVIISSTVLVGQNKRDWDYLGVTIGAAVPIGEFASSDVTQSNSGLGKTGYTGTVSLSYTLIPRLSLLVGVGTQVNGVDIEPIINQLSNFNPNVTFSIPEGVSWQSTSIFGGILLNFPIDEKATFYFKAMLGLANTTSPEIKITGKLGNNTETSTQSGVSSNVFSFIQPFGTINLTVGLAFNLGSKVPANKPLMLPLKK